MMNKLNVEILLKKSLSRRHRRRSTFLGFVFELFFCLFFGFSDFFREVADDRQLLAFFVHLSRDLFHFLPGVSQLVTDLLMGLPAHLLALRSTIASHATARTKLKLALFFVLLLLTVGTATFFGGSAAEVIFHGFGCIENVFNVFYDLLFLRVGHLLFGSDICRRSSRSRARFRCSFFRRRRRRRRRRLFPDVVIKIHRPDGDFVLRSFNNGCLVL